MARSTEDSGRIMRELAAIGLVTAAALVLVNLICSGPSPDASTGIVPYYVASGLRLLFGVGAYAVPMVLFIIGVCYWADRPQVAAARVLVGAAVLFVVILTATALQVPAQELFSPSWVRGYGGYLGAGIAYALGRALGTLGTSILLAGMGLAGLILLTHISTAQMVRTVVRGLFGAIRRVYQMLVSVFTYVGDQTQRLPQPTPRPPQQGSRRPDRGPEIELGLGDDDQKLSRPGSVTRVPDKRAASPRKPRSNPNKPQPALLEDSDLYTRPPLDLLTVLEEEQEVRAPAEEITENIIKLEDTLHSFGVAARVTHYEQGPVITRYEVEPERGVRVGRVANLADDLAMALAAVDVRVEAPIPGKSAVGIEVPNQHRGIVSLRGLLESPEMQQNPSPVAVALGRDIAGHPVIADLDQMPHLLVAGATNSGKSVCLHSIITSILMRARPDEVRFIMIDPKRVEMRLYDGIPHLFAPVVHSPKEAADVLKKVIREMDKRYDLFAMKGVVNLDEYNELARQPKQHRDEEFEPLPRVVIIVDELADLMMQSRAEFEYCICRLAQLARATGIHLVVATQRPSVNVITGTIKANIPSRIALAVTSQHDSRTILDGMGAERLIGRGDMLYAPADSNQPKRVQGAFVPRADLQRIVEHLTAQGEPDFAIIPHVGDEDEEDYASDLEVSDKLYAAAVQYVVGEGEASVSMLQRRFKIGYARAGRLIDTMEQRGVVGPHEGPKPRQVLITAAALQEMFGATAPADTQTSSAEEEDYREEDELVSEDDLEEEADLEEEPDEARTA